MSEATARPWTWSKGGDLRAAIDGYRVNSGVRTAEERDANRELIVLAVNAHDDLLAACEGLVAVYDRVGGPLAVDPQIDAARAAIDKAKGATP